MSENVADTILQLEKAALESWAKGDPDGFLEISAPDVVYFDPFLEKRLDGHAALKALYDTFRGKFRIERYEMIDPKVNATGDMAVLTFNFKSEGTEGAMRWNASEVYARRPEGWRIVHTHWSFTKPQLAGK